MQMFAIKVWRNSQIDVFIKKMFFKLVVNCYKRPKEILRKFLFFKKKNHIFESFFSIFLIFVSFSCRIQRPFLKNIFVTYLYIHLLHIYIFIAFICGTIYLYFIFVLNSFYINFILFIHLLILFIPFRSQVWFLD